MPSSSMRLTRVASREARRRLGEMLGRGDRLLGQGLARAHGWKATALLIVGVVVAILVVEGQEAIELDDLTRGTQVDDAQTGLAGRHRP